MEVNKNGLNYHTINSILNIVNKDQTPIGQAYKITLTIEQNIK